MVHFSLDREMPRIVRRVVIALVLASAVSKSGVVYFKVGSEQEKIECTPYWGVQNPQFEPQFVVHMLP